MSFYVYIFLMCIYIYIYISFILIKLNMYTIKYTLVINILY